jgi:hypothetical protein
MPPHPPAVPPSWESRLDGGASGRQPERKPLGGTDNALHRAVSYAEFSRYRSHAAPFAP